MRFRDDTWASSQSDPIPEATSRLLRRSFTETIFGYLTGSLIKYSILLYIMATLEETRRRVKESAKRSRDYVKNDPNAQRLLGWSKWTVLNSSARADQL